MNHETTIKRIQELTGGMELEFGCEVMFKEIESTTEAPFGRSEYVDIVIDTPEHINDVRDGDVVVDSSRIVVFRKSGSMEYREIVCNNREYQILGKPITLAVVLLAISKNRKQGNNKHVVIVADNGFMENTDLKNYNRVQWNLSKDNFNDQSEETKMFIGGLLGN